MLFRFHSTFEKLTWKVILFDEVNLIESNGFCLGLFDSMQLGRNSRVTIEFDQNAIDYESTTPI